MRRFREDQAKEARKPRDPGTTVAKAGAACGEQDVADGKPGCPHARPMHKAPNPNTKDPLAIDR